MSRLDQPHAIQTTMSNQVLIVAAGPSARQPAEIARSLQWEPVLAATDDDAIALIDSQRFNLIAVAGNHSLQRLREAAERKQPMTRVMELPAADVDGHDLRAMLTRYLQPPDPSARPRFSEERYRFLSGILESFT